MEEDILNHSLTVMFRGKPCRSQLTLMKINFFFCLFFVVAAKRKCMNQNLCVFIFFIFIVQKDIKINFENKSKYSKTLFKVIESLPQTLIF